jgi:hypothetical protein
MTHFGYRDTKHTDAAPTDDYNALVLGPLGHASICGINDTDRSLTVPALFNLFSVTPTRFLGLGATGGVPPGFAGAGDISSFVIASTGDIMLGTGFSGSLLVRGDGTDGDLIVQHVNDGNVCKTGFSAGSLEARTGPLGRAFIDAAAADFGVIPVEGDLVGIHGVDADYTIGKAAGGAANIPPIGVRGKGNGHVRFSGPVVVNKKVGDAIIRGDTVYGPTWGAPVAEYGLVTTAIPAIGCAVGFALESRGAAGTSVEIMLHIWEV